MDSFVGFPFKLRLHGFQTAELSSHVTQFLCSLGCVALPILLNSAEEHANLLLSLSKHFLTLLVLSLELCHCLVPLLNQTPQLL